MDHLVADLGNPWIVISKYLCFHCLDGPGAQDFNANLPRAHSPEHLNTPTLVRMRIAEEQLKHTEKKKLQEERDRWIIMKLISLKGTLGKFHVTLQVQKLPVPKDILESGAYEGGAVPLAPPYTCPPWGEGTHGGGGSFNFTSACIFLPQAIYIIHCILESISNEKILKQFVEKNPRILDIGGSIFKAFHHLFLKNIL